MSIVGKAVKSIFGGGSDSGDRSPLIRNVNITSPGFKLTTVGSGDTSSTSLARTGSLAQERFGTRVPRILGDIDTLRGTIKPGFSFVRDARLSAVQQARARALSNIKGTFSARRLSGSSFAAGAIANTEREFAQAEGDALAQSFLEELQANTAILNQEFGILGTDLEREFQELQIASGVGTQIAQILSSNAQFAQKLAAEEEAAAGGFLGSLLKLGLSSVSKGGPFAPGGIASGLFSSTTVPAVTAGGFTNIGL